MKIDSTLARFNVILSSDFLEKRINFITFKYIPVMQKLITKIPGDSTNLTEEIINKYNIPRSLVDITKERQEVVKKYVEEIRDIFKENGISKESLRNAEETLDQMDQNRFGNQGRQLFGIINNHNFETYDLNKSLQELGFILPATRNVKVVLSDILVKK